MDAVGILPRSLTRSADAHGNWNAGQHPSIDQEWVINLHQVWHFLLLLLLPPPPPPPPPTPTSSSSSSSFRPITPTFQKQYAATLPSNPLPQAIHLCIVLSFFCRSPSEPNECRSWPWTTTGCGRSRRTPQCSTWSSPASARAPCSTHPYAFPPSFNRLDAKALPWQARAFLAFQIHVVAHLRLHSPSLDSMCLLVPC